MRAWVINGTWERRVVFDCPGCGEGHQVPVERWQGQGPLWRWSGRLDEGLTLTPSLRVTKGDGRVCHLTVEDGRAHFHHDCTAHALGGTVVELPEVDD